ncbi:hypothetical protein MKX08_007832 [Trichoderma sp. CBMAI-0020]|nr:hypothetical protein MKX08_007832 [Trichoderma sp. CBMAI-0020]
MTKTTGYENGLNGGDGGGCGDDGDDGADGVKKEKKKMGLRKPGPHQRRRDFKEAVARLHGYMLTIRDRRVFYHVGCEASGAWA